MSETNYKFFETDLSDIESWLKGLTPTLKISADKWADANVYLTTENSNKPGKFKTQTTPYMREILECLSPTSPVRDVIWPKGVQIGATTVGIICMLCFVDTDPAPIMYVLPTVDIAKGFSKTRLQKIIDNSESLRDKIKSANIKGSGNTIQEKEYPGGYIILTGANSAAGLRSRPIRVLIMDETDAYVKNLDKEGSPIKLAEQRTATYEGNKKVFKLSTPTIEGQSVIWKEFERTDQRYYHVPCPHCGVRQKLLFDQLRWTDGQPETVKYECAHCFELIPERFKTIMLDNGIWIPDRPDLSSKFKRGYHLNSMYSAYGFMSWARIIELYEEALEDQNRGDNNNMQVFVNTIKGLPFSESGDAPDWELLFRRRETYKINSPNNHVYMISAGVDVQGDRLELEIVGWGKDFRTWSLDYRIILGNPSNLEDQCWKDLAKVLSETWIREDGLTIPLRIMGIDSSYFTTIVYQFCAKHDSSKVVPLDGRDTGSYIFATPFPAFKTKAGKGIAGVKIFPVGTFKLKKEFYNWVKIEKSDDDPEIGKPGYCHFPEYSGKHFEGLTAEEEVVTWLRGYPKIAWNKKFTRNEPLDCRCYARAAIAITGYDRFKDQDYENLLDEYRPKEPIKKVKRLSDYMN